MKKTIPEIMVILLLASMLTLTFSIQQAESSEPPGIEWSRTYGGEFDDMYHDTVVIQTSDGGYAIAGYTENFGAVQKDFWLVKINSTGHEQWNKTYDREGGVERPVSVIQTSDGGYAITGVAGTSEAAVNSFDFWLIKTDADGNHEWNKTYDGGARDEAMDVVETNDGGYAIVGYTTSFGGDADAWLIKTHSDGTMEWNYPYGDSGPDYGYSMVYTSAGEYIIAGQTGPYDNTDFWLIKVNSTGHMQWSKAYGGSANTGSALSVISTTDGGYAMTGYMWSLGASDADFWLAKTDSAGNMEWNKAYGGGDNDHARGVVQTNDEGYAIVGATKSFGEGQNDFWLVKTNSTGNMEWNETYGGPYEDWGRSLVPTLDGGYAIAGYTNSFGAGGYDCWLIKIAPEEISATVDIDPDTLNLKSNGEFVTAYIELPAGCDVAEIDLSTVQLEGISAITDTQYGFVTDHASYLVDHDGDGILERMVKFDRIVVRDALTGMIDYGEGVKFYDLTLTVTGELVDGTPFEGTDAIVVIMK